MKKYEAFDSGIEKKNIEHIIHIFKKYPEVEKAILYGSRAMGTYHVGSDIDLTLEGEKLDLSTLNKIINDIYESPIPYKVDLSIKCKIENNKLLEHIEKVGKIFYSK